MYITEYFNTIIKRIENLDLRLFTLDSEIKKLSGWSSDAKAISYLPHIVKNETGIMAIMENSVVTKELQDYENEKGLTIDELISELYKEKALVNEEKVRLTTEKDLLLSSVLKFSNIRIDEAIWLLKQYGLHFSPVVMGDKTYLVPVDFKFQGTAINGQVLDNLAYYFNDNIELFQEEVKGTNLPIYFKDGKWVFTILPMYRKDNDAILAVNTLINKLVREKIAKKREKKDNIEDLKKKKLERNEVFNSLALDEAPLPFVNYYVKTSKGIELNQEEVQKLPAGMFKEILEEIRNNKNKIYEGNKLVPNNQILNLIPSIKVLKGVIPFYNRDEEFGVKLNEEVLNIFPEEALGVIEYYIERKCVKPTIKLEEAYQELANKELTR